MQKTSHHASEIWNPPGSQTKICDSKKINYIKHYRAATTAAVAATISFPFSNLYSRYDSRKLWVVRFGHTATPSNHPRQKGVNLFSRGSPIPSERALLWPGLYLEPFIKIANCCRCCFEIGGAGGTQSLVWFLFKTSPCGVVCWRGRSYSTYLDGFTCKKNVIFNSSNVHQQQHK